MAGRADAAEARARKTNRLAELVWHLTECDPWDVAEICEAVDTRVEFTHDAVLTVAARAIATLEATGPRTLRTPGFLRRNELVTAPPVPHHTSLRRWDRSVPADERARAFVRRELAEVRREIAEAQALSSTA